MIRDRRRFPPLLVLLPLLTALLVGCTDDDGAAQKDRPNILQLVLDDVGYSDLAPFGGEVPVPNIESIVRNGVKFTDFSALPNCSPTRAVLFTGVDNHRAGLGNMAETLIPEQMGKPGYEGVLNDRVATVAELLRDDGYHTYLVGKWHLGGGEQDPYNRGFEETFTLLQGLGGHFEVQQAYEGAKTTYTRNGKEVAAPNGIFDAENDTNQLINFIDSHNKDGKPFFAHWAVRMAHDPLQAPPELIQQFRGRYDQGYDVLRAERIKRMKDAGVIPQTASVARREPVVTPWAQLTTEEQQRESREMEVYAAMMAAADIQIGRILNHLRDSGELENTLIVFLSDNGPNAETIAFYGAEDINRRFNNKLENIGNHDSFVLYGPGWAQASAGPFRLYKGFVAEGGIRTAMVMSGAGVTRKGQTSDVSVHVADITPTILDAAGVKHPDKYKGRSIEPLQGKSILPFLKGTTNEVHAADEPYGVEMWGRAALRKGDWKLLWVEPPFGTGQWELYDFNADITETHDLSKTQTAKFNELMADWEKYVKDNRLILKLGKGIGG